LTFCPRRELPLDNQAIRRSLAVGGLVTLTLGMAGCAAVLVGSVVGTVDVAGYEYVYVSAPTSQGQRSAQQSAPPKFSLNDIE